MKGIFSDLESFNIAGRLNLNQKMMSENLAALELALQNIKGVISIDLSNNEINDKDISHLCEILENYPGIQELNLSHNQIGDIGAIKLANCSLKRLDLSHNCISERGILALSVSLTLSYLNFSHNPVAFYTSWQIFHNNSFHNRLLMAAEEGVIQLPSLVQLSLISLYEQSKSEGLDLIEDLNQASRLVKFSLSHPLFRVYPSLKYLPFTHLEYLEKSLRLNIPIKGGVCIEQYFIIKPKYLCLTPKSSISMEEYIQRQQEDTLELFIQPEITNYILDTIDFSFKCFQNQTFSNCSFKQANLTWARMNEVTLKNCNFENADLAKVTFLNCQFINTNFTEADLTHTSYEQCNFKNCNFQKTNLKYARFFKSYFEGTTFSHANLSKGQFFPESMGGINHFCYANLSEIHFGKMFFNNTNFDNSILIPEDITLEMLPTCLDRLHYKFKEYDAKSFAKILANNLKAIRRKELSKADDILALMLEHPILNRKANTFKRGLFFKPNSIKDSFLAELKGNSLECSVKPVFPFSYLMRF